MTVQLERQIPGPIPRPRRALRPVEVGSVQEVLALDLGPACNGPRAHPEGALLETTDLDALAQAFARVLVEVLAGDRGPHQLLRWSSPEVYTQLQRRSALLSRTLPGDRRVRALRSQVRSVRLGHPQTGVLELAVHVRRGQRSHAVAARLEQRLERSRGGYRAAWVCTALEAG